MQPRALWEAGSLRRGTPTAARERVDDDLGERLVAFVQPADDAVAGPDLARDLTAFARQRMAAYKVPREFHFRATLPRTPTGKMVKGRLQEEYAATR